MNDCINMETKTCFFGYGGIIVSARFHSMYLIGIKPPIGSGSKLKDSDGNKIVDWDYTGSKLSVLFDTLDEVKEFYNMLDSIKTKKGGFFEFKGVIFDFNKYEEVSVEIVRDIVDMIKREIFRVSAC